MYHSHGVLSTTQSSMVSEVYARGANYWACPSFPSCSRVMHVMSPMPLLFPAPSPSPQSKTTSYRLFNIHCPCGWWPFHVLDCYTRTRTPCGARSSFSGLLKTPPDSDLARRPYLTVQRSYSQWWAGAAGQSPDNSDDDSEGASFTYLEQIPFFTAIFFCSTSCRPQCVYSRT